MALQVELYFGDFNTPSGSYSTRNEVEALNLILSLASQRQEEQLNAWKELQTTIIDKIRELSNQTKMDAKIDENYNCELENNLVKWGQSDGSRINLEIACKFLKIFMVV